mgnify:CR=1 FL=1
MMGIKGDMAGGAAVAAAIYALAANQVKVNVTGVIPMCENRISVCAGSGRRDRFLWRKED